jgi:hypothetical protein
MMKPERDYVCNVAVFGNRITMHGMKYLTPHTAEWFSALEACNPEQVAMTKQIISLAGTAPHPLRVVNATCESNNWNNTSDRNLKERFEPVDPQAVLAKVAVMPIQTWNCTNAPTAQHIGPTAQDFRAAFGLGESDPTITTVDCRRRGADGDSRVEPGRSPRNRNAVTRRTRS